MRLIRDSLYVYIYMYYCITLLSIFQTKICCICCKGKICWRKHYPKLLFLVLMLDSRMETNLLASYFRLLQTGYHWGLLADLPNTMLTGGSCFIHPGSLTVRPWTVTFQIGKGRLPTTIFQGLCFICFLFSEGSSKTIWYIYSRHL